MGKGIARQGLDERQFVNVFGDMWKRIVALQS